MRVMIRVWPKWITILDDVGVKKAIAKYNELLKRGFSPKDVMIVEDKSYIALNDLKNVIECKHFKNSVCGYKEDYCHDNKKLKCDNFELKIKGDDE